MKSLLQFATIAGVTVVCGDGRRAGHQRCAAQREMGARRVGRRRQGRRAQPHDAGARAEGRRPRQAGQGRHARQDLRLRRPGLRHAQLEAGHSGHADRRSVRRPEAGLQRRAT